MKQLLAAVFALALPAAPMTAWAAGLPSYATGDETIHGRIVSIDGTYGLHLHDDRGFIDNVTLHDGTVITPTGVTLVIGQIVTIHGHAAGNAFAADEIDTPYDDGPAAAPAGGDIPYAGDVDSYPYAGDVDAYPYPYAAYPYGAYPCAYVDYYACSPYGAPFGIFFGFGGGYYGHGYYPGHGPYYGHGYSYGGGPNRGDVRYPGGGSERGFTSGGRGFAGGSARSAGGGGSHGGGGHR
jgi:hypothetical protein